MDEKVPGIRMGGIFRSSQSSHQPEEIEEWMGTPRRDTVCGRAYNFIMTQEAQEPLQKALVLPDHERAELAGTLISSLDATVDPDVDAAWQQEVARRLHEVQSGKVGTISWEEVQQKGRTLLDGK